jgi:hypothetical protein
MAPVSRENVGQWELSDMLLVHTDAGGGSAAAQMPSFLVHGELQRLEETTGRGQFSTIHTRAARAHFISKRLLCWGSTGTATASSNRHHHFRRLADGVLLCAASSSIFTSQ